MAKDGVRIISFGVVKFVLSEQDIDVATVIPKLPTWINMRGAHIRGGVRKFEYQRSKVSSDQRESPAAEPGTTRDALSVLESPNVFSTEEHDTKSILELEDSTSDALLKSMNEQMSKIPKWPFVATGLLIAFLLLLFGTSLPAWVYVAVFVSLAATTGWMFWQDQLSKLTVLFYETDDETTELCEKLSDALRFAASAQRLRSLASTSVFRDTRYSAGAGRAIQLNGAKLQLGNGPSIVANIQVPLLSNGATTLAFYPDRVLAFQNKAVGSIEYAKLSAVSSPVRFVEDNRLASDATVVDRTWRFVRNNGWPDLRFKNNHELPVCVFNMFSVSTPDGLDLKLFGSKKGCFDGMAHALSMFGSYGAVIEGASDSMSFAERSDIFRVVR
ncbi:MAG: hypothetical protein CVV07_00250 [Gammaproteobacteria bacterium HGW-Gammaproteobacteria-11]|nr:MAG: hypothetical protein CVV07_00250 [Gammaproteobacteria bacterium HGW-Gammaproteobacteria-11]